MTSAGSAHPDPVLLQALADGALEAESLEALQAHLRVCPACRSELAGLRGLIEAIDSLPDLPLGRDLSRSVLERIRGRRAAGARLPWIGAIQLAAGGVVLGLAWRSIGGWMHAVLPRFAWLPQFELSGLRVQWEGALEAARAAASQLFSSLPALPWRLAVPSLGMAQAVGLVVAALLLGMLANAVLLRRAFQSSPTGWRP